MKNKDLRTDLHEDDLAQVVGGLPADLVSFIKDARPQIITLNTGRNERYHEFTLTEDGTYSHANPMRLGSTFSRPAVWESQKPIKTGLSIDEVIALASKVESTIKTVRTFSSDSGSKTWDIPSVPDDSEW